MKAQVCRFKRTRGGEWEPGIMIGVEHTETMLIVDVNGKPILQSTNVYDFDLQPYKGCFEIKTVI